MGNEQGNTGCFSPRQLKPQYHSEVIKKRSQEIKKENEGIRTHQRLRKENLHQSVPNLLSPKLLENSITIEIKINLNENQESNPQTIQRIQKQIPKLFKSQELKEKTPIEAKLTNLKFSQGSTKNEKSIKTCFGSNDVDIQDIDLPSETSYCQSQLFETETN